MIARMMGAGALLAACLVVLVSSPPAQACSCVTASTRAHAKGSDAVFTGTISGRAYSGDDGLVVYRVSVDSVWKGNVPEQVEVATGSQGSACGLPGLPSGKPILWFAGLTEETVTAADFSTSLCQGTQAASQADTRAVTAALGEAERPLIEDRLPPAAEDRDDDRNVALAVSGAVLVAGLAAYVVVRRRRTSGS